MTKVRVPVIGTIGKSVQLEADAPSRTEMDAAIAAALAQVNATGGSSTYANTLWRLIGEIPQNIRNLVTLLGTGLVTRLANGTFTVRSIATAAVGDLTVTNANGAAGNPTLALGADTVASLDLADSAVQPADVAPLFDATYVTVGEEGTTLSNSRQLVAGTNVTFDVTTPGELRVDATGGGGSGSNVTPDTHPTSPDAADDDFEDGSTIDTAGTRRSGATAWAWRNQGGATANLVAGSLILFAPASAGTNHRIVEQVAPSGAWKYRAKVRINAADVNFAASGLVLLNSSNGRLVVWGVNRNGGTLLYALRYTDPTTFSAAIATPISYTAESLIRASPTLYLEVESSGTVLTFRYSYDGITFNAYSGTETISAFLTASGGALDRIGLDMDGENSNDAYLIVDWFRKVA